MPAFRLAYLFREDELFTIYDRPDADIPIIAMTADAFSDDIRRCLEHGMDAHVAKPINIEEVSRLLKKYLGR